VSYKYKRVSAVTVDGHTFQLTKEADLDAVASWESETIPAAKTGTLTTRTDNDTGTLTLQSSHGVTTGAKLDVFWSGGYRAAMTVGTVSGNSVPIDAGAGDNLPTAATAVTVMVHTPNAEPFSFTQTGLAAFAAQMDNGKGTLADFLVSFYEANGTSRIATIHVSGTDGVYQWTSDSGVTNPLNGANPVAFVVATHADSARSHTVRISTGVNN
jgi:hypothetical protein